jgi:MFS transporter, DHA1 family, multidrug resistance protein
VPRGALTAPRSVGDRPTSGWLRLSIVFALASFIEAVGFGHFISFLPLLVEDIGVAEADVASAVGTLSAAALFLGLPLVPFWGAWADRYSRKVIVVRSAVIETLLFALLVFTHELWQLFLLVPLVGLVLGNTGVMLAELTDRTPRARLGFSISLVGTAGPLGFAIGPAFGGVVADRFGVQSLFLVDAILTAAVVVLLVVGYHERRDRERTTLSVLTLVRRSLVAVVRHPLARAVFVAYFLLLLGQRLTLPFLAIYVEELAGPVMLATTVGLVAGGYGIAASLGSPLGGLLGDRIGYRRMYVAAVGVVTICLVFAAVAPTLLPFALAYAAYGVGFATASSMLYAVLATGLPDEIRSPVLNLALAPLYLSGVLGSLITTAALEATGGDLRPLWAASAGIVALGAAPAIWFAQGRR